MALWNMSIFRVMMLLSMETLSVDSSGVTLVQMNQFILSWWPCSLLKTDMGRLLP